MDRVVQYARRAYFLSVSNTVILWIGILALGVIAFFAIFAFVRTIKRDDEICKLQKQVEELEDSNFQRLIEKGEPDGYCPLGPDAIVPPEFLPPIFNKTTEFLGCWYANTNTPPVMNSTGLNGQFYIVCEPGNTTIDGISDWDNGDFLIFEGNLEVWLKNDGSPELPGNFTFEIVVESEERTGSGFTYVDFDVDECFFSPPTGGSIETVTASCPGPNQIIACECYWTEDFSDNVMWITQLGGTITVGTEIPFVPDTCECPMQFLSDIGVDIFTVDIISQVTCVTS